MKRTIYAAALLAMGVGFATPVLAQGTSSQVCLQPIRFYSWKALDNRTVIVTDRLHHDFKLSLAPGCYNIDYSLGLGVKSFSTSRLSCVARGDQVIVPRDAGMPRQTCFIQKVEAYTPDMAKADAMAKAAAKAQH
jgi:hypothetical protein